MYFPPGDPVAQEDPRHLADQFWRAHDKHRNAQYGERYVAFIDLVDRANNLPDDGWDAFARLYHREHTRRKLPAETELDWYERARVRRGK